MVEKQPSMKISRAVPLSSLLARPWGWGGRFSPEGQGLEEPKTKPFRQRPLLSGLGPASKRTVLMIEQVCKSLQFHTGGLPDQTAAVPGPQSFGRTRAWSLE